jgi:hypothetical protein
LQYSFASRTPALLLFEVFSDNRSIYNPDRLRKFFSGIIYGEKAQKENKGDSAL